MEASHTTNKASTHPHIVTSGGIEPFIPIPLANFHEILQSIQRSMNINGRERLTGQREEKIRG